MELEESERVPNQRGRPPVIPMQILPAFIVALRAKLEAETYAPGEGRGVGR